MLTYGLYIAKLFNIGNTLPVTDYKQSFEELDVANGKLSINNLPLCLTNLNETSHINLNETSHINLGALLLDQMGAYEKALENNEEALEKINASMGECITPVTAALLLHNLAINARILNHLKESEEALIVVDKVLTLDSKYGIALLEKANILYSLQRYEEALIVVDKAIQALPYGLDDQEAIIIRDAILMNLNNNTLTSSIQSVEQHFVNTTDQDLRDDSAVDNITSIMNVTNKETTHDTNNITLSAILWLSISGVYIILSAMIFIYQKCKNSIKSYNHDDLPIVSSHYLQDLEQQDYKSIKLIGENTTHNDELLQNDVSQN